MVISPEEVRIGIAINDFVELIISNSSTCKKCALCHSDGKCFFSAECVTHDFCHFTKK